MKTELPKGWEWKRLGDLCTLITDGTHATPKYVEEGIPFISSVNIDPNIEGFDFSEYRKFISSEEHEGLTRRCYPQKGDLLISKCGTIGRTKTVDVGFPFSIFVGLALLKIDNNRVDGSYLEKLLNSELYRKRMEQLSPGTSRKTLTLRAIGKISVPLPPLQSQREIVAILDKAEETKRLRVRANELTQKLLQSVFIEMFGDPLKNPYHWNKCAIKDVTRYHKQGLYTNAEYSEKGIKLLRITDITGAGEIDCDTMPLLDLDQKTKEQFSLKAGEFVFARSGVSIGRCAIVEKEVPCVFGSFIIKYMFDANLVDNQFILHHIRLPSTQALLKRNTHGSANPNINAKNINELEIILPPLALQKKFSNYAKGIRSLIDCQMQSSCEAKSLLDSLTSRAFSGELVA
jgi:restriction endonuclease S subunit